MKGLNSILVFFFCLVLVCHASVEGVIISETVRQNLILTHRQSVNETALIFEFVTENFLPEVIGKTIEKIKLELPSNLEEMLPMENITGDYPVQTRNCSLQQLSVHREDAELTLTLDSLSDAHIDQDQKKLVLCVIMTRQILIDSFQEYTSPASVISTRDPKWQIASCMNETRSLCNETHQFNSTTKYMTSSRVFGSGKCCKLIMNVPPTTRLMEVYLITNEKDLLPLVPKSTIKGVDGEKVSVFVGAIPDFYQILLVYEEDIRSAGIPVLWKNCISIRKAISTTLVEWNYREKDFTIYDEFCDCNESLLQTFNCKGPPAGLVVRKKGILTTLTSAMFTSSNPQCNLLLKLSTTFQTYAGVSILSRNGTKFRIFDQNRKGSVYEQHSQEYRVRIGQIDEEFQIKVDLQRLESSSLLAVDSISLGNCTASHSVGSYSNCSSSQFMCKTGVCIERSKRCNLAKDCFHGDDEEHCESFVSNWRCDFEVASNKTCRFMRYQNNRCGDFRITPQSLFGRPGPDHTNAHHEGNMLYFERRFCQRPFSPEIETQKFKHIPPEKENNASICTLSITSKGENSCWWNLYLCQETCFKRLFRGSTTGAWKTDIVTLSLVTGSYHVKIKAKDMCEWMAFDDIFFSPNCFSSESEETDIMWWVEILVPFVCFVVLVEIIVVSWAVCQRTLVLEKLFFLRNRKHSDVKDILGESRVLPHSSSKFNSMLTESNPNYALLTERTLNECIRNIPFTNIHLETLLGEGTFGQVYKGRLLKHGEERDDMPIAIKKLPAGSFKENISDFLLEALTLGKFDHTNIVRCLGITSDPKGELLLILELMEGGDLRKYLRNHKQKEDITVPELLKISLDIALGCQYLEDNKFIHRDIAARNCLLSSTDSNKIAKIGDFGFAIDIYGTDYYKKNELSMVPVRWMPEESFKNGKYSSKSDVWAFGVLLWEVFSFGQLPYEEFTNCEVMAKVMNGHRLGQPRLCPIQVYSLMGDCWNVEPEKRPCFNRIVTLFTSIYALSFPQKNSSSGISSLKSIGGKHRLNTYSLPEEVDNAIPLLEGDCTLSITDDVFGTELNSPV